MIERLILPFIIALTACFSTTARASNQTHVTTMSQEDAAQIQYKYQNFNPSSSDAERFWKKVDKNGPQKEGTEYEHIGNCWIWTAAKFPSGYGAFEVNLDRTYRAHIWSFLFAVGKIPVGMEIMHRCDTKCCVRPEHLSVGTRKQNAEDASKRGRYLAGKTHHFSINAERRRLGLPHWKQTDFSSHKRGVEHHQAKITPETVREIRLRYLAGGISQRELATEYGLSQGTIGPILKRKIWKHVT